MKVLLVEDDLQKAERVKSVLKSIRSDLEISLCRSYQSGLRFIQNDKHLDFIILDMSLPTFDANPGVRSGRPRSLGGYDIMRKLKRLNIQPNVVVLTALENFGPKEDPFTFSELRNRCRREFDTMFREAIYYSQSRSDWIEQLKIAMEL